MKLSAPILEQMIGSFKGDPAADSLLLERRRQPRTPFVGQATIIRCNIGTDRKPTIVRIRDLSAGGIGIKHNIPLAVGERFVLVLPTGLAALAKGVLCLVANSRPTVGGEFEVGATFVALLQPGGSAQPRPVPIPVAPPSLPVETVMKSLREQPVGTMSAEELTTLHGMAAGGANGPRLSYPGAVSQPRGRAVGASKEIIQLLTRDDCIQRAEQAMQARTLSGVVAQVIAMAASPRSDMADLASLIARDPMLAARILQAANSVSYASTRGIVATIPEAVRNIGCATIRDIAATFGVFDAMPQSAPDGFNPIRCWQHSFAVATLCQRLAADEDGGSAYLVGLCHDLGEILFHSQFGPEYRQVIEVQEATGKRRDEVERQMLGITHGELAVTILRCMSLPDAIRTPIEEFHAGGMSGRALGNPLARVLRLAEFYATGALLASSAQSPLSALSRPECRNATGKDEPQRPDGELLRGEIFALTAMLARLSAKEEAEVLTPFYPKRRVPVLLVRDPSLSSFDPIHAALESLAEVTVRPGLPPQSDVRAFAGIVIAARNTSAAGFTGPEIAKSLGDRLPVLWLAGRIDGASGPESSSLVPTSWPIPLSRLGEFVTGLNDTATGTTP